MLMKKYIIILCLLICLILIGVNFKTKTQNIIIKIPLGEVKKIKGVTNYNNDYIKIDENNNIYGLKKGKTNISVNDENYTIIITEPIKDINTYDKTIKLKVNEKYKLNLILKENINITNYEYDKNIIDLNNDEITALNAGTTSLKIYTNNNTSIEINIIVEDDIILNTKKLELLVGEYKTIQINAENVIWKKENENIELNNGTVKAINKGTSKVYALVNGKELVIDVVIKDSIDELKLNAYFINIKENEEYEIKANVPLYLLDLKIDNPNIAYIKDNKIIGKNKGKTILTSSIYDKKYYTVIYVGEYNLNYNYNKKEFINYFDEVALSNEYMKDENSEKIQKWNKPIYYNYINASNDDINKLKELEQILNNIPGFPGLHYNNNDYDILIEFMPYTRLYGLTKIRGIEGYSNIEHNNNIIYKGNIYISSSLDKNKKNSVICEELLHTLGLKNDTKKISNSVLYEYGSDIENLSDYDLLALNILYSNHIGYGMTKNYINKILEDILK